MSLRNGTLLPASHSLDMVYFLNVWCGVRVGGWVGVCQLLALTAVQSRLNCTGKLV